MHEIRYRPRLKVCCIANEAEAALAIAYGASALGLVGAMPSGPGPISDAEIAHIAAAAPLQVATFLLTSEQNAAGVIAHYARVRTSTIQIVDELSGRDYLSIRQELPEIKLVQVIHVTGPASVDEALEIAPSVDAILLDSGDPTLAVKELGGTGRTHDWRLSRSIVDQCTKPVFLAGGLNAQNVRAAIDQVRPFGIDICSGVRTKGSLDERKLSEFVSLVDDLWMP